MSQRTNSLAFAKSDCHTCNARRRPCDRQRPICSTCQAAGDACAGFQTSLIWEGSSLPSRRGDDSKRRHAVGRRQATGVDDAILSAAAAAANRAAKAPAATKISAKEFAFVSSWPPKRRKKHVRKTAQARPAEPQGLPPPAATENGLSPVDAESLASKGDGLLVPDALDHVDLPRSQNLPLPALNPIVTIASSMHTALPLRGFHNWPPADTRDEKVFLAASPATSTRDGLAHHHLSSDHWLAVSADRPPATARVGSTTTAASPPGIYAQDAYAVGSQSSLATSPALSLRTQSTSSASSHSSQPLSRQQSLQVPSLAPPMRYTSLAERFSILIDRYDQEFCTYPVTNDLDINPFRYRRETSTRSNHLLHAMIAFAVHHRTSYPAQKRIPIEYYEHRNHALVLYKAALDNPIIQARGLGALDTLMALWCLDTIESALKPWRAHLSHALSLLELGGGIGVWSLSCRTQTQVTVLLWWDAVVALLSRRPCVMPYGYFDAVLRWESASHWTAFELVGIPRDLLVPLMQMAHLAGQSHVRSAAHKAVRTMAAQIENALRRQAAIHDEQALESGGEEALHEARDRYHCCESIRNALLIYAIRVFPDDDALSHPARWTAKLRYLSRMSLDHACSIRPSSPALKQLLLVLFFAGAETNVESHKVWLRDYCTRWHETFGYPMFTSAIEILDEVWAKQDVPEQPFWWGDAIDARRRAEEGDLDFCYG